MNADRDAKHVSMSNPFFEHPILNSPYKIPTRHWELDDQGQPTKKQSRTAVALHSSPQFPNQKSERGLANRGRLFLTKAKDYQLRNKLMIQRQSLMTFVIKSISGALCRVRVIGKSHLRRHICFSTGDTTSSTTFVLFSARSKL